MFQNQTPTLLLCIYCILYSSCNGLEDSTKLYVLADYVSGLSTKSKVEIAGFEVGEVTDFSFTKENRVVIEMSVEPEIRISHTAQVYITPDGFLGEQNISLIDTVPRVPYYANGDTLLTEAFKRPIWEVFGDAQSQPFLLDSLTSKQLDSILTEEIVPELQNLIKTFTEKSKTNQDTLLGSYQPFQE